MFPVFRYGVFYHRRYPRKNLYRNSCRPENIVEPLIDDSQSRDNALYRIVALRLIAEDKSLSSELHGYYRSRPFLVPPKSITMKILYHVLR